MSCIENYFNITELFIEEAEIRSTSKKDDFFNVDNLYHLFKPKQLETSKLPLRRVTSQFQANNLSLMTKI